LGILSFGKSEHCTDSFASNKAEKWPSKIKAGEILRWRQGLKRFPILVRKDMDYASLTRGAVGLDLEDLL